MAVTLSVVGPLREVQEAHPVVGRGEAFADHPAHVVGDAVTDEQHLDLGHRLTQHGVDGQRQGGGLVVDRDRRNRPGGVMAPLPPVRTARLRAP